MCETWEDVYEEPEPSYRKEISVVGRWWMLEEEPPEDFLVENEMEALMRSKPHQEVQVSPGAISKEEDYDQLIETLSEEERAVVECCIIAGHSVRLAANLLGLSKSHVQRTKAEALEKLGILFGEEYGS